MISVRIVGGLGNQLFQYAIARKLSLINNEKLFLNITEYFIKRGTIHRTFLLDKLNIFGEVSDLKSDEVYKEKDFGFDAEVLKKKDVHLFGYWQSPKYFHDIRDVLSKEITLKGNNAIIPTKNVTSIHVRRGDYLAHNKTFNLIGMDYYNKAIEIIGKINFSHLKNVFYSEEKDELKDFFEMSLCENNIIGNSTYSWWAAYLGCLTKENKKVICPTGWFVDKRSEDDLIPNEWVKI